EYTSQKATPIIHGKKIKVCGLNAQQYFRQGMRRPDTKYEFEMTDDLSLPRNLADTLSVFCGTPPGLGVPLNLVRHEPNGEKIYLYKTLAVKKEKIDPAVYKIPTDLTRKMPNPVALMLDENAQIFAGASAPFPTPSDRVRGNEGFMLPHSGT